jgi:VanZ family protein
VKRRASLNQATNELLSLAKAWVPPLLVSLVILVLSGEIGAGKYTLNLMQRLLNQNHLLSLLPTEGFHTFLRKVAHFVVYGSLGFYYLRAFQMHRPTSLKWPLLWVVAICLTLALLDEGRQSTAPSRVASWMDIILDITAAAICAEIAVVVYEPTKIQSGPLSNKPTP